MSEIREKSSPTPQAILTYSFAGFVLDPVRGALSRPSGAEIRLRPKSAEVLQYFLDHAGRVVGREELLRAIWPNVAVTDESITQCVADIRRGFGDVGVDLLRTLPKRGYLFSAKVTRGTPPAPDRAISPPAETPTAHPSAERRQLTVLFCDAIDPGGGSDRPDPEDQREAVAAYHRIVAEISDRYAAHLTQYPGNWAALYFGWPAAHEHNAERAVRAALAMNDAVGQRKAGDAAACAGIRIGIATGTVVTGDLAAGADPRDPGIVGAPPTRAARLAAMAESGCIMIDATTRHLTGALFEYADIGEATFDGTREPIARVLGESPVESRYEALRGTLHPPMIGRDEELDLLLRRWHRAVSGEGHVVLVSGEPGIGKSRLVAALQDSIAGSGVDHERLDWFCAPHLAESALRPVINRMERATGFVPGEPSEVRLDRLAALLAPGAPTREEVALLADLLSIPLKQCDPVADLPPRRRRIATLNAMVRRIRMLSQHRPVLAVLEDAHWIDPTTRELLDLMVAEASALRMLVVVTYRPEFDARAWSGLAQVTELHLTRLGRGSNAALIRQVAGGKALPSDIVEQILVRTDGVPLFVEELTKAVLEAGLLRETDDRFILTGPMPDVAVPATLHASLLARLDRLAAVRGVAQAGAVIGREFAYDLLATVSELPEASLRLALAQLAQAELVRVRGVPPDAVYSFKHALVRDAAYESLLKSRRAELHAAVVRALEARVASGEDIPLEVLAQHCAQAGLAGRAVNYFEQAGSRAAARSALVEARTLFMSALDQLARCPAGRSRDERELELLTLLGSVLVSVSGYSGAGRTYLRARELWDRLGRPSRFLRVPCGQWLYHANIGELDYAEHIAEDLTQLSQERQDAAGLVLGCFCLCGVAMVRGQIARMRASLDKMLLHHASVATSDLVQQIGLSPKIMGISWGALTAFWRGYPETALATSDAALALARGISHQPSLASALTIRARLFVTMDDNLDVAAINDELLQLMETHAYPFWGAQAMIYDAWLRARRGDLDGRAAQACQGRAEFRSAGGGLWETLHAALVADILEAGGNDDQAVQYLEEALSLARGTGEGWYTPEVLRRRSKLHRRKGEVTQAEALLRQAVSAAEACGTMQWKLRSATELADLLSEQGRCVEARDLLAPTVAWFSEGFGMRDLTRATALLHALDARGPT